MWACKQKSIEIDCGRLNARGFKQINGQSYDSANIHTHATSAVTVKLLILFLLLMTGWMSHVADVKGDFLHKTLRKERKFT